MEVVKAGQRDLTPSQEDYVETESSCCLCGSALAFQHVIDWLLQKVVEKAHCPSCGVKIKEKEHQLH